jgi:hypothetical protein
MTSETGKTKFLTNAIEGTTNVANELLRKVLGRHGASSTARQWAAYRSALRAHSALGAT